MNAHLFVYGTLMRDSRADYGRAMRERLAREARLVGTASTAGRLYDLGRYPGLTAASSSDERVHGELLELVDPAASFRWLDAYEGISPGATADSNEYARLERPVRLDASGGADVLAWVYVYQRDASRARLVPGGRWLSG